MNILIARLRFMSKVQYYDYNYSIDTTLVRPEDAETTPIVRLDGADWRAPYHNRYVHITTCMIISIFRSGQKVS